MSQRNKFNKMKISKSLKKLFFLSFLYSENAFCNNLNNSINLHEFFLHLTLFYFKKIRTDVFKDFAILIGEKRKALLANGTHIFGSLFRS